VTIGDEGDSRGVGAEHLVVESADTLTFHLRPFGGEVAQLKPAPRVAAASQVETGTSAAAANTIDKAIAAGAAWLVRRQAADGGWYLGDDPKSEPVISRAAATGLAVLAILGAGTPPQGDYQAAIDKGLAFLARGQKSNGDLSDGRVQMYSHALACMAVCRGYGRTKDPKVGAVAQKAIDFIVDAQNGQGGWRYTAGSLDSDTSVFGWQFAALEAGEKAGLKVPPETFRKAGTYLDKAQRQEGALYAYRPDLVPTPTMTAVGLACRVRDGWDASHPAMQKGVAFLVSHAPSTDARNTYSWYHGTRLLEALGGQSAATWREAATNSLLATQERSGPAAGSWNPKTPTVDTWGAQMGREGLTCFSLLILEQSRK
jgi:hypothetical protein